MSVRCYVKILAAPVLIVKYLYLDRHYITLQSKITDWSATVCILILEIISGVQILVEESGTGVLRYVYKSDFTVSVGVLRRPLNNA